MKKPLEINIAIVIDNDFSMLELSEVMEPFNVAYSDTGNIDHSFKIYTCDGLPKTSSCQSTISTNSIGTLTSTPDIVFIMSAFNAPAASSLLLEQLESCHAINNSMIVGVGAGIQWLYQCQIIDQNDISNGLIDITTEGAINLKKGTLYSIRNNITLCAGGTACLDMALKLISVLHNKELSIRTAEKLACPAIRSSKHHRFETTTYTTSWTNALKGACQKMNSNLK
ncbi:MAG: hypothetical protein QF872_03960 [Gammaproteobacteria bacterium]|nr:hypothetical protein [Gammaproteobacteria bacterium]